MVRGTCIESLRGWILDGLHGRWVEEQEQDPGGVGSWKRGRKMDRRQVKDPGGVGSWNR